MSINKLQGMADTLSALGADTGGAPVANAYDVQWFSAMLDDSESGQGMGVSDGIINGLSNSSGQLQQLSDNAAGELLKASKSLEPQDVIEASRSLSSFYLQSLLTAKLVSKGTQAVEKLTNLQ